MKKDKIYIQIDPQYLLKNLGIKLEVVHFLLVALIPLWVRIFPSHCSFICIFSPEQGFFFLFNLPGMFIEGTFFFDILQALRPEKVRLSGDIIAIDYITMYLFSALTYYIMGFFVEYLIEKIRGK
jgi:hypothetical protein